MMKRKNPDTNNCVFLFHHLCSPIYSSINLMQHCPSLPPLLFNGPKNHQRKSGEGYIIAAILRRVQSSGCLWVPKNCVVREGIGDLVSTRKHLLCWTSLRYHCAFDYTLKNILDCCNFVSMIIFSGVTCSNPNHDIWWNWDVCKGVRAFS